MLKYVVSIFKHFFNVKGLMYLDTSIHSSSKGSFSLFGTLKSFSSSILIKPAEKKIGRANDRSLSQVNQNLSKIIVANNEGNFETPLILKLKRQFSNSFSIEVLSQTHNLTSCHALSIRNKFS